MIKAKAVIALLAPHLKVQPDRFFANKVLSLTKSECFGSVADDSEQLEGYVERLRAGGDFCGVTYGTAEDIKRVHFIDSKSCPF